MYQTDNINDLEKIYSILKIQNPGYRINVVYDNSSKLYSLEPTNEVYTNEPEVPLDLSMKVIYGDSVVSDTPILLRNATTKKVIIECIEDISTDFHNVLDKEEAIINNLEVYSNNKWNTVEKIIKHKTDKQLYNVLSPNGFVTVTEDHSLLTEESNEIKPNDCDLNTKLLHSYPLTYDTFDSTYDINVACLYGFILRTRLYDSSKCDISIPSEILKSIKIGFDVAFPDIMVDIYEQYSKIQIKILNRIEFTKLCYKIFNNGNIPDGMFNEDTDTLMAFMSGYLIDFNFTSDFTVYTSSLKESAGFYYILKKLEYFVTIYNKSTLFVSTKEVMQVPLNITKVYNVKSDYVYDIQTSLGCFQAGIGSLIVKNTDSIFIEMKYNRDSEELNRKDSFKFAKICGDILTKDVLNRKPIELEFEKVFQPFVLLTKKRYIGKKYEDTSDPMKLKEVTVAGIALTRRDYCSYTKKCYQGIVDELMGNGDTDAGIIILKKSIIELVEYKANIDDLVLTSLLGSTYKTRPVHLILAEKLKARNEEVQVGDRIPYIYIEHEDTKLKKTERGEDPEYAKLHGLKYCRGSYMQNLIRPVLGFFKVVLHREPEKLEELIEWVNTKMISCGGAKFRKADFILNTS